MTQLIIESVPYGAEVTIGGQTVGTTPLAYTIDEAVGLAEFRTECLSGENVACSWDDLKTRLEDLTVSRLWWDLTRDERYSIAEMAIKNTLFYSIFYRRTGKPNCEGGEGELVRASCVNNAIIRCLKFGEFSDAWPRRSPNADECYYMRQPTNDEHCYVSDSPYKLPCYYVSVISEFAIDHAVAAIQIKNGYDSLDNWAVFQYESFDIKPGDRQIPYSSRVIFSKPGGFQCGVSYGTTVAEFSV